ncbi:hypothetical protein GV055_05775 [Marinomonas mediterranea]|jgi:hypothetical protein|uniref:Transmembrane protein n=2 Tax=Marinomonas mediterranea TaxID=119864 RepID=F2JTZ0_MARM1|nr:hypothetical protein Marme_1136 [Marinomonas mediterranea MMB-1]WCN08465.1 hypothetical protein GV055_05775 [Marinomonas mediterranea]WCN12520.1 hypothetical protein GV054_05615 [Marinomonas mediterranea]WCN16592.1 hypothetical protein GV053_05745 [Marinomonas mediterranea MMB-1]
MKKRSVLHELAIKLGKDPKRALMKLIQGGLLFLFGTLMILVSERALTDSMVQELAALLGVIVAAAGVIWSLIGYLSMSILRIYHMLNRKD